MSELIKRLDVFREIQHSYDVGAIRWREGEDLMGRVNALPTIDAVKVVRCGECKFYWKNGGDCVAEPNWFCADGEREVQE